MRRRHGNGQRPDITSTHFRRTHPVALSPGTYPELRYLPHTIRYSSIGNGHCAGGKYGAERPVCLWRKMTSPCLQTFVVAPSTSGKGILSLVRLLVEPFHDEIRKQTAESMACYRRENQSTKRWEKNGRRPKRP